MKKLLLIAGIAALGACGQNEEATVANDANDVLAANEAVAEPEANLAATPAAMQLNETTWTLTDKDGQAIQESIDASGNYIANAGDKHVDHGTAVIKDGKACFTSAMEGRRGLLDGAAG